MDRHEELPTLSRLQKEISAAKAEIEGEKIDAPAAENASLARGASELFAGVAVGGFLGWQLDAWLDMMPVGLVVGVLLGLAAGVMNLYRASSLKNSE